MEGYISRNQSKDRRAVGEALATAETVFCTTRCHFSATPTGQDLPESRLGLRNVAILLAILFDPLRCPYFVALCAYITDSWWSNSRYHGRPSSICLRNVGIFVWLLWIIHTRGRVCIWMLCRTDVTCAVLRCGYRHVYVRRSRQGRALARCGSRCARRASAF